jgi:hypothetical protein
MMWRIAQKIGIWNGGQRWLYANKAAKSRLLMQKSGVVCVEWRMDRWFLNDSLVLAL